MKFNSGILTYKWFGLTAFSSGVLEPNFSTGTWLETVASLSQVNEEQQKCCFSDPPEMQLGINEGLILIDFSCEARQVVF